MRNYKNYHFLSTSVNTPATLCMLPRTIKCTMNTFFNQYVNPHLYRFRTILLPSPALVIEIIEHEVLLSKTLTKILLINTLLFGKEEKKVRNYYQS